MVFFKPLLLLFSLFLMGGCNTEPVETDLLFPVDFSNIPENMVLTEFHTDKIEIRIRAAPRLMERLNTETIRYPVDLYTDLAFDPAGDFDSIEPGEYLIPVYKKRIPMNPAIKILAVKPAYVSVRLEKKVRKFFQIKVPYTGTPAQGYTALEATTDPPGVELIGPESVIESIFELKTKPIDLTNVNEAFKKKIPLDLEDPSVVSFPDQVVTVTVPLEQQLVSKTVDIPVLAGNTDFQVKIEPAEIILTIKGPFDKLSSKEILDRIYAYIDLKDMKPGVYVRHAEIDIPVDLIMTDAGPQVFTIKIK
ncbi:MAG: CdaR family protein [Desulfobacteraceae bacterium]|nr:CdaR family protein [Desulfobacteraceae bacterium]